MLSMLSLSKIRGASRGDYYINLGREDYYFKGGEPPGIWQGKGAKLLNLEGRVDKKHLKALMLGLDPYTNRPLVKNPGESNRQTAWDLTFSAPKSVSVAWSQSDKNTAKEFQISQAIAVQKALTYLEENAGFTRRGKDGLIQEKCSLIFATFEHGTSRAQDPQLHTHALALNACIRDDGTTGTIRSKPFFTHQMAASAIYRQELSYQIYTRLHLKSHQHKNWFEIDNIPENLIEEFSKRRIEIEEQARKKGINTEHGYDITTLKTREEKQVVPREELFREWQETGNRFNFSTPELNNLINDSKARTLPTQDPARLAKQAVEQVSFSHAYFPKREIIRFAAQFGQARNVSSNEILKAVDIHCQNNEEIVRLGTFNDEELFSTKENLRLEKELLELAKTSTKNTFHQIPEQKTESIIRQFETLSDEQKLAIKHITEKPGSLQIVSGMAGTGKSFMLDVARSIWQKEGYSVLGAALAGKAARGLEESAKIPSRTIHSLLFSLKEKHLDLSPKHILVVDEAGMIGTKQMLELTKVTLNTGAKLILVGDAKQLQPIEAGGPFKALARELGEATLTSIRRQNEKWAREAVFAFSCGEARAALTEYANRKLLFVEEDRTLAITKLIADWKQEGINKPESHLILAATNLDVYELNQFAQLERGLAQALTRNYTKLGKQKFFEGDRIVFTKNDSKLSIKNGDLASITKIQDDNLSVTQDSGKKIKFSLSVYEHIKLGYCVTTHKAQGVTVDHTYILLGGSMQDRELSYVQASRARGNTKLYIDEINAGHELTQIVRKMELSHQKDLASHIAKLVI